MKNRLQELPKLIYNIKFIYVLCRGGGKGLR